MATHSSATRPRVARRSPHRLAGCLALLIPLLAACGTGFQAQTNQIYQPGPGISVRTGGVYTVNMLVVSDGAGNGTLVAALINQAKQPDTLESVSLTDRSGRAVDTTIVGGTVSLPSQRAVQFADTGAVRAAGTLTAGAYYSITLTFRNAAPVTVMIPVVSRSAEYDAVPLGPLPTSATPS
ncbi:MAG: hypothetical protein WKF54_06740 [Nocardioidaceae bacterium]